MALIIDLMKLHLQRKIYHFLQSAIVRYLALFFISISIISVIATSFKEAAPYRIFLFGITYISSFIFLLEYTARIYSAPAMYENLQPIKARLKYSFSFYGFVDFVAVLPCILTYFFWETPLVHIVILPYIFIIFKLIRHSKSFQIIGQALALVKGELITAYTACFILIAFSATLMYYIERDAQPEIFRNIGDGFWWCIVTFTTTGYGDIYPITGLGKLLGSIISLIGIAMIAIPTGIISSSFMNIVQSRENDRKKLLAEKEKGKQHNAKNKLSDGRA